MKIVCHKKFRVKLHFPNQLNHLCIVMKKTLSICIYLFFFLIIWNFIFKNNKSVPYNASNDQLAGNSNKNELEINKITNKIKKDELAKTKIDGCVKNDKNNIPVDHYLYLKWQASLGEIPIFIKSPNGEYELESHIYADIDNESLKNMALAQDEQAMLALGHNLIWQAAFECNQSPELGGDFNSDCFKFKPDLDTKKLDEGRNWLFYAAVYGLPFALKGILSSYNHELIALSSSKKLTAENKLKITNTKTAIKLLIGDLAYSNTKKLTKNIKLKEKQISAYKELKSKLFKQRVQLGIRPFNTLKYKELYNSNMSCNN